VAALPSAAPAPQAGPTGNCVTQVT